MHTFTCAYILYFGEVNKLTAEAHPTLPSGDIRTLIRQTWKQLSDESRKMYLQRASELSREVTVEQQGVLQRLAQTTAQAPIYDSGASCIPDTVNRHLALNSTQMQPMLYPAPSPSSSLPETEISNTDAVFSLHDQSQSWTGAGSSLHVNDTPNAPGDAFGSVSARSELTFGPSSGETPVSESDRTNSSGQKTLAPPPVSARHKRSRSSGHSSGGEATDCSVSTATKSKTRKKSRRDPAAPKHPRSAFLHYLTSVMPLYTEQHRGLSIGMKARLISEDWSNLPAEAKEEYVKRSDLDKQRYREEKEAMQERNR
ncbi:hypothetical protein HDU93_009165 [Gonapodya sp. JEL0774]|nr:hypothetical protein HDU93_009165 [Gonapodya sp. JEL0774]